MKIVFYILTFLLACAVVSSYNKVKAKPIPMVETFCPMCHSNYIIDYGKTIDGEQKCHCSECGKNFIINL